MANQEDINRARKGKDVWNAWADENPGTYVDLSKEELKQINFAGFVFPGAAGFANATLDADASFKDAIFLETTNFQNAKFGGSSDFRGATFKGEANFHRVRFVEGNADFDGATFEGHANFLSAKFEKGAASFNGTTFIEDAIFQSATFAKGGVFWGARFGKLANFLGVNFSRFANFHKAAFSDGPARFDNAAFPQIAHFGGATFGKGGVYFLGTNFGGYATFDEAAFTGYANFQRAIFNGEAAFRGTEWHGLVAFNDTEFRTVAVFKDSTFESVPTFHGATLHEDTTFEGVTWPKQPHEGQSPFDAVRAWARLRVEMNRLNKHEDELRFFEEELKARTHDKRNEPRPKRLLYRIYLALGAGRSVVKPFFWLAGLNTFLFFPIYWVATSNIQWREFLNRDVLADVVSFNIPGDVISFTLGQVLPLIGGSNPERRDLYERLFPRADCGGIDVPLWLQFVGAGQQLAGVVLVFLIGLALRNRFRMK